MVELHRLWWHPIIVPSSEMSSLRSSSTSSSSPLLPWTSSSMTPPPPSPGADSQILATALRLTATGSCHRPRPVSQSTQLSRLDKPSPSLPGRRVSTRSGDLLPLSRGGHCNQLEQPALASTLWTSARPPHVEAVATVDPYLRRLSSAARPSLYFSEY